jgi:hypothetical protein
MAKVEPTGQEAAECGDQQTATGQHAAGPPPRGAYDDRRDVGPGQPT